MTTKLSELRAYLLGRLPDNAAEDLDARLFSDDDLHRAIEQERESLIEDYLRARLSPEEDATAADTLVYGDMTEFAFACPYLTLIQSDPASLDQLRELKVGRRFSVPLSKFSAKARKSFTRWLHVLGPRMPTTWSSALWPDFDQVLAGASVEVSGDTFAGQSVLRFSLSSPSINIQPWGMCPVGMNPISLRE